MSTLTNESKKTYKYTSRYASVPYFYNTVDKKHMYGLPRDIMHDCDYIKHTVSSLDTLDSLAFKYYGRPDLFWFIALFNDINDPFINLSEVYEYILIPSLSGLRWR